MKAYYINLERAIERRRHMEAQAQKVRLDLVRVEAVDGRQLTQHDAIKFCPSKGRTHSLSLVEVACFLSHRKAWENIVNGSDTHAIVLEDDLYLSPDFERFAGSCDWISNGCDVVKIETIMRPLLLGRPCIATRGGRNLWRMESENMGGGGYILSRESARILLENTQTFVDPVDCVLFHPASFAWDILGVYQLVPALCVQQVRSKKQFLEQDAEVSYMDGNRGVAKRRGASKVLKELVRPIQNTAKFLVMYLRACLCGGRFGVVKLK
jgi:glycosyl transferase, family 25